MEEDTYTATRIGRCDCAAPAENPAEELTLGLNPNNGTGPGIPGVNPLDGSPREVNPEEAEKNFRLLTDEKNIRQLGGHTLHRIECTRDFKNSIGIVTVGQIGGFVESEDNIIENGWVWDDAIVCDKATVLGCAAVMDNACVMDHAFVAGNARVMDHAQVYDNAQILDYAIVYGNALVCGNATVRDSARVFSDAIVDGYAIIRDNASVGGQARIRNDARIINNAFVGGVAVISTDGMIGSTDDFIVFQNVGSRHDNLYAYKTKYDGVRILVGCFFGSIDEFKKQVLITHQDNEKVKNEYLAIIGLIKNRFDINV